MAATVALHLSEIRPAAAAALAPLDDDDPTILETVVDSLEPPAIMVLWDDPWLVPGGSAGPVMGPCLWTARLLLLCFGGRADPGASFAAIEDLIAFAVTRLRADPNYIWPPATALSPRAFDVGGVPYLAGRLTYPVIATI